MVAAPNVADTVVVVRRGGGASSSVLDSKFALCRRRRITGAIRATELNASYAELSGSWLGGLQPRVVAELTNEMGSQRGTGFFFCALEEPFSRAMDGAFVPNVMPNEW